MAENIKKSSFKQKAYIPEKEPWLDRAHHQVFRTPNSVKDAGLTQATKDYQEELARRQRTKAALAGVTATTRQNIDDYTRGQASGRSALRHEASQGLAGAVGQTGAMASGGGAAAQIRQTALDRGSREAAFEADTAQGLMDAKTIASQTALEEQIALQEMGSQSQVRTEKIQNANEALYKLRERYEGGIFSMGEDVENFLGSVRAMLAAEGDPVVRDVIARRAVEIADEEFQEAVNPDDLYTNVSTGNPIVEKAF
tara:strand:- start:12819 stop:13583 length:765 start_codon:yes stop_codon:yes gene_type:complete